MRLFAVICMLGLFSVVNAGTIMLKDGTSVSGVKLLSIVDGKMNVQKGKEKKSYNLKKVKAYYTTDISDKRSEKLDNTKFDEYEVVVDNVVFKSKNEKKDKPGVNCEVEFSIRQKDKDKPIKRPYFYLYVLVKKKKSPSRVLRFCLPRDAEPKGEMYDEAAIIKKLTSSERGRFNKKQKKLSGGLTGRKKVFHLNNVKLKNIAAWHLEVWGNSGRCVSKSGQPGSLGGSLFSSPGKGKWWLNPKYYNR